MAGFKDKVKFALDETRMVVLGAQILLGFQYRFVLEKAFNALPTADQTLAYTALALELAALLLLMWPAAFHQIVEDGEITRDVHAFTTRTVCWALAPFTLAFGINAYLGTRPVLPLAAAVAAGVMTSALAGFFWFGWEWIKRHDPYWRRKDDPMADEKDQNPASIHDKVDDVLTEARVVIPGVQALLGFQFIAIFMEVFATLPRSSRWVHLGSLALIAVSTVLLMTPAAFHRIVEDGESTERFRRFAAKMLLVAMGFLAAGFGAEAYVVATRATESAASGTAAALLTFGAFTGCWFGYTFYRARREGMHPHLRPVTT